MPDFLMTNPQWLTVILHEILVRMYESDGTWNISLTYGIIAGVLIAAVAFGGGFLVGDKKESIPVIAGLSLSATPPADVDFSPVWKAWAVIDEKFVPVSVASSTPVASSSPNGNQERVCGMIEGLAASLDDPFTFFLPPR